MANAPLSNGEQDTRDEIGFLLIHQGFADRFFPGTSVLHTRIRYVLFIPWLYRRGSASPSARSRLGNGDQRHADRACDQVARAWQRTDRRHWRRETPPVNLSAA